MELICYEVEPGRVDLRPAGAKRDWMDATPGSYAYRCLPVTMANSHGWEILCPLSFELTWNGEDGIDALEIHPEVPMASQSAADYLAYALGSNKRARRPAEQGEKTAPANIIESHFGSGVLTFNPLLILQTPPGYNLWVTGPVNLFKDAIQPMSALIETDWMPFTFSMNWKVTRPHTTIRFTKGEPFCAFFPTARGVVEQCEPVLKRLGDNPELEKTYWSTRINRNLSSVSSEEDKDRYQTWYAKRANPDQAGGSSRNHSKQVKAKPFESVPGDRD